MCKKNGPFFTKWGEKMVTSQSKKEPSYVRGLNSFVGKNISSMSSAEKLVFMTYIHQYKDARGLDQLSSDPQISAEIKEQINIAIKEFRLDEKQDAATAFVSEQRIKMEQLRLEAQQLLSSSRAFWSNTDRVVDLLKRGIIKWDSKVIGEDGKERTVVGETYEQTKRLEEKFDKLNKSKAICRKKMLMSAVYLASLPAAEREKILKDIQKQDPSYAKTLEDNIGYCQQTPSAFPQLDPKFKTDDVYKTAKEWVNLNNQTEELYREFNNIEKVHKQTRKDYNKMDFKSKKQSDYVEDFLNDMKKNGYTDFISQTDEVKRKVKFRRLKEDPIYYVLDTSKMSAADRQRWFNNLLNENPSEYRRLYSITKLAYLTKPTVSIQDKLKSIKELDKGDPKIKAMVLAGLREANPNLARQLGVAQNTLQQAGTYVQEEPLAAYQPQSRNR